jgi:transposase
MSEKLNSAIAVIGIDIGKSWFHVVGHDRRGAIVLRQKWSRGQVETRLANLPPCLIGMEACVGAHHLSRKLQLLGHDARLMPAKYVRSYSNGQKNDFRDAEAIAEAVQRPDYGPSSCSAPIPVHTKRKSCTASWLYCVPFSKI